MLDSVCWQRLQLSPGLTFWVTMLEWKQFGGVWLVYYLREQVAMWLPSQSVSQSARHSVSRLVNYPTGWPVCQPAFHFASLSASQLGTKFINQVVMYFSTTPSIHLVSQSTCQPLSPPSIQLASQPVSQPAILPYCVPQWRPRRPCWRTWQVQLCAAVAPHQCLSLSYCG